MVKKCRSCPSIPYRNICCCPSKYGVTVTQPCSQSLPDGRVVNNPCYQNEFSYWTYKFFVNCDPCTQKIQNIGIPINKYICKEFITVEECIDGCGNFNKVKFKLLKKDPYFCKAPPGYVWLKIINKKRYGLGVCVFYRITIRGNFRKSRQAIAVKNCCRDFKFCCDNCYIVPGCRNCPELILKKDSKKIIKDNKLSINYVLKINNVSSHKLENVNIVDRINYPASFLNIGKVEVEPELNVSTTKNGLIEISGNIGDLKAGDLKTIAIKVNISSITEAGKFNVVENATVFSKEVESNSRSLFNIEAVKLDFAHNSLTVKNVNEFVLRIIAQNSCGSPETDLYFSDYIHIPPAVIIQFTSFDGLSAFFAGSKQKVPLYQNITNCNVLIKANNLNIKEEGKIYKNIKGKIVEINEFKEKIIIENRIDEVKLYSEREQILLDINNNLSKNKFQLR